MIIYPISTENFSNPERGQYTYTSTGAAGYDLLDQTELTNFRVNDKITLIWREFRIQQFVSTAISASYLTNMQTDFDRIRNAGVKAIVRITYTHSTSSPADATKAQMLSHMTQLAPVLQANDDVISSMEAGFIGAYGEWAYSDNFGSTDPGPLTAQNLADRQEIGLEIMDLLPTKMVAFRTPQWQRLIGGNTPLSSTTAYNGSVNSRVAAHNDCFVASASDYGTYSGNGVNDKAYLEQQARYTFDGGETCNLNTLYSNGSNAMYQMNRFYFNYLNIDYNEDVLDDWVASGQYDEIVRRLGYRFELWNSTIVNKLLSISIRNVGFGHVFNSRNVKLILKNVSTSAITSINLATDIRYWQRQEITNVTYSLSGVPSGSYSLHLHLPDNTLTASTYAIRFANTNVWDSVTGYNDLGLIFTQSVTTYEKKVKTVNTISLPPTVWMTGSSGNYSIRAFNNSTTDAIGDYSVAEGSGTTAIGTASHAEGWSTIASGHSSHAEGMATIAIGDYSHAEGSGSVASGTSSHAEGINTMASGYASHAEGWNTLASGVASHAEGAYTTASGIASHAGGWGSIASGDYSHAEGNATIASGEASHADGYQTQAIGDYSHADGYKTIAFGFASHADGYYSTASGTASHAEGAYTLASGYASHAEGSGTTASGDMSHAQGDTTVASGYCSHASGAFSQAYGAVSFVHGSGSTVVFSADNSIALGVNITAYTPNSTYVDRLSIKTIGSYISEAAATADATLPSGGVYTLNGSTIAYIK